MCIRDRVSLPGIVLGKYLAAVTVMACTVLLTLVYVLVVALYGAVYPGELMVGYLGFILQGDVYKRQGIFCWARFMATPTASAT